MSNVSPEVVRRVFGVNSDDPVSAARESTRQFVRGRAQIALFEESRNPTGRVISALEALRAYGLDLLDEAIEYGSALLLAYPNAVGASLRRHRQALALDHGAVARLTGVSIEDLQRIEAGKADDIRLATIEKIAFAIGLDEAQLAFRPELAGGTIAGRLKTMQDTSPNAGISALSKRTVTTLTEAASVIRTQHHLQESLGLEGRAGRIEPDGYYGSTSTPAWKVGYQLAQQTRRILDLGRSPMGSMRDLVERDLGIPVIQVELPRRIAGATISVADSRGIVLNLAGTNENPLIRRATLAHEIGHLLFDPEQNLNAIRVDSYDGIEEDPEQHRSGASNYVEQRANAFAISFLAPIDQIREMVRPPFTDHHVRDVGYMFGISGTAAQWHITNAHYGTYNPPPFAHLDGADWLGPENFTIDYPIADDIPVIRRGRFTGLVLKAWKNNIISTDTAALYLKCNEDVLRKGALYILEIHDL